jgi:DNA-binding SARP family transcriptional activator
MLDIQLFGTGQARYCDQPLAGFPGQQAHHLFCYLLLNRGQPISREKLAAVFWGDYSTPTSRKYLRNALWRLRQSFQLAGARAEDFLAICDDSVAFVTTSSYRLDIELFEKAVSGFHDRPGENLTTEQAAVLEKAVELYTGDLLQGVYEDWCLYDRERLGLLLLNALSKLMEFHAVNGAYERGITYGERILARDNTREKVHRRLMRLHWLAGDRNAALTQYKRCAQILREELGIPPMDRTQFLYEQMLHNRFNPYTWARTGQSRPSTLNQSDDPLLSLADHALQKLQHLQAMIEETSAELRQVERLITKALLETRSS